MVEHPTLNRIVAGSTPARLKITKKDKKRRYMISNNHCFDNSWTHIYGKAVKAENDGIVKTF